VNDTRLDLGLVKDTRVTLAKGTRLHLS